MKIKIRKVEVDVPEFIDALEEVINVHEVTPNDYGYEGTTITYVAKNMGIKEFDFWNIYSSNLNLFDNRIEVVQNHQYSARVLYRSKTLKKVKAKKALREPD